MILKRLEPGDTNLVTSPISKYWTKTVKDRDSKSKSIPHHKIYISSTNFHRIITNKLSKILIPGDKIQSEKVSRYRVTKLPASPQI